MPVYDTIDFGSEILGRLKPRSPLPFQFQCFLNNDRVISPPGWLNSWTRTCNSWHQKVGSGNRRPTGFQSRRFCLSLAARAVSRITGNMTGTFIRFQFPAQFESIHLRHHYVTDDQVGYLRNSCLQNPLCRWPIHWSGRWTPGAREYNIVHPVIFHHQDARCLSSALWFLSYPESGSMSMSGIICPLSGIAVSTTAPALRWSLTRW